MNLFHARASLISLNIILVNEKCSHSSTESTFCLLRVFQEEKKNRNHWHEKLTCWMRRRIYCWCVLWLWDVNASRSSDKQQTIFFTTSGKREAAARQDRSSSQSGGRAPANLNKEGRRSGEGVKEVRGEGRHDWAQLQHRHSLRWCGMGKGGFYFTLKEIISPSNCLLSRESQPNHLQLLRFKHIIYALWF